MLRSNQYNELVSECYLKTDSLNLNRKSHVYFYHIVLCIAVLYVLLINQKYRSVIPKELSFILLVGTIPLFLQKYIFTDVLVEAQECAAPTNKDIPWGDGDKLWYKNMLFFFVWIFAIIYGLHFFSKGNLLFFNPGLSANFLNNKFIRTLCILPLLGFIFSFNYIIIKKGNVVKPLPSRHRKWERPLATYFTLVFIPFLLITIFGGKVLNNKHFLYKLFTCRITVLIFLFAAFYFIVWRLNGGLFLTKQENDKLKEALQIYNDSKDKKNKDT